MKSAFNVSKFLKLILLTLTTLSILTACTPPKETTTDSSAQAGLPTEQEFYDKLVSNGLLVADSLVAYNSSYGTHLLTCNAINIYPIDSASKYPAYLLQNEVLNLSSNQGGTFYASFFDCINQANAITSKTMSSNSSLVQVYYRPNAALADGTQITLTFSSNNAKSASTTLTLPYYSSATYTYFYPSSYSTFLFSDSCYRYDLVFRNQSSSYLTTSAYSITASNANVQLYSDSSCTTPGVTGSSGENSKTIYFKISSSADLFNFITSSSTFTTLSVVQHFYVVKGPVTATNISLSGSGLSTTCQYVSISPKTSANILIPPAESDIAVSISSSNGYYGTDYTSCASSTSSSINLTIYKGQFSGSFYYRKINASADTITATATGFPNATLSVP